MALLEVRNLKKSFGSTKVLRGIDLSLEKGRVLVLIGSSGNGKTTFLRCLNFLETPEEGSIVVNGETLLDAADKRTLSDKEIRRNRLHFGLVFQSFNLFPQYTALENVMLAMKLLAKADIKAKKITKKESDARIREEAVSLLTRVGLSDKLDHYPCQLSGGQQQRVAIARALALHPDILCFDEPTSALDPEITGEVLNVIRQLREEQTTMVIVTHEMGFAREVADEVVFMDEGTIVEQGPPEALFEHPKTARLQAFLQSIMRV
ncbi:MAG: amino acid ABC transporter ATP-binding protein [Clostridia bacterium]|nr:amino acid ABC transporter ATP-binding protein [Clostridia bacterium]